MSANSLLTPANSLLTPYKLEPGRGGKEKDGAKIRKKMKKFGDIMGFVYFYNNNNVFLQLKAQIARLNRIGSFLLVVYLMILAVGFLHVHESEENAFVCQDCTRHVKHNAHITQASVMDFDCVLCKVVGTDYIIPEIQTFSAVVLLFATMATRLVQDVLRRTVVLPSLRAPPF